MAGGMFSGGRNRDGGFGGMHHRTLGVVVDGIGFIADEKYDGAARGQCGERLVGGIQKQHPALQPVGGLVLDGREVCDVVSRLTGAMGTRMVVGQDVQRSSPRPTIVDVGGLELSVRPGLM